MSRTMYGWVMFPAMVMLLVAAGCAPFAYLVTEFSPPQTVPAKYEIPSGKRVMVFVDDYSNPDELIQTYDLKRRLTEKLNEHFIEHDVAREIVPFPVIAEVRTSTPDFRTLYVEQVGDKLQADIVVYVHVDNFAVRDDQVQPLWHGKLQCSVKVLDVAKGMAGQGGKLWPQDAPMREVQAVDIPAETETSSNYGEELADELTDTMADRIGKLFHDYKVRSSEVGWDKAKTGATDQ